MEIIISIFLKIISMSIIASIVGLLVICVKRFFEKVPVNLSNILWIFVLVLLIVPIEVSSSISIQNYIQIEAIEKVNNFNKAGNVNYFNIPTDNIIEGSAYGAINWMYMFTLIWLIVSIALICRFVIVKIAQITCKKQSKVIDKNVYDIFLDCKKSLKISNNVELILQDKVKTPAIYGVVTPNLLINENILDLSNNELRYIFTHELIHFKKKDIYVFEILKILKCIYWFNPILIYIFCQIKRDLEYATDEMTVSILKNRKEYCKTLLKISMYASEGYISALGICDSRKELERRIRMVKSNKKVNYTSLTLFIVSLVVIMTASISLATSKINDTNVQSQLIQITTTQKYIVPVNGVIGVKFGSRVHPVTKDIMYHNGIDIIADQGTAVVAIQDGIVEEAGFESEKGNYIKIMHKDCMTEYNHLSKISVQEGDSVAQGQNIGEVGSTGYSTGPHLHFSIIDEKGNYIDPEEYIEL